jgi:hypothetical protein
MRHSKVVLLAVIATVVSMAMYVSYLDQIRLNVEGRPGSIVQPLIAFASCFMWSSIGFFRKPRDWPVALAGLPGVILGPITVITAIWVR